MSQGSMALKCGALVSSLVLGGIFVWYKTNAIAQTGAAPVAQAVIAPAAVATSSAPQSTGPGAGSPDATVPAVAAQPAGTLVLMGGSKSGTMFTTIASGDLVISPATQTAPTQPAGPPAVMMLGSKSAGIVSPQDVSKFKIVTGTMPVSAPPAATQPAVKDSVAPVVPKVQTGK